MRSGFAIAVSVILAGVFCPSVALRAIASTGETTYEEFRLIHRKGQDFEQGTDPVSFVEREALFNVRKAEVDAHNAKNESWTLTLNHFTDYTKDELKATHGLKRTGARFLDTGGESSFLQLGGNGDGSEIGNVDISSLAKTVDWRLTMNFSNFVHNQGACGSCWAHAAVAAIEAHAEIQSGIKHELSTQSVIDCAPNPRKCGGAGGCKGSTGEIAYEYVSKFGIPFKDGYSNCKSGWEPAVSLHGFVRIPENRASFLKHALSEKGPVVMSVDAGKLHAYHNGVFSGCDSPDSVPNHAVVGVGYGFDNTLGKGYWLIKNSWGGHWGEDGYIRVETKDDDNWMCGTDHKPEDGVYCEHHPDTIPVCGMCGIISDSVYPILVPLKGHNLRHAATHARNAHAKFGQVKMFWEAKQHANIVSAL